MEFPSHLLTKAVLFSSQQLITMMKTFNSANFLSMKISNITSLVRVEEMLGLIYGSQQCTT